MDWRTMTKRRKFNEGDKVRDRADLSGTVLETWGNGVKVRWDDLYSTWIDERFLTLAGDQQYWVNNVRLRP